MTDARSIRIYETDNIGDPRIQLSEVLAALGKRAFNSTWTATAVEGEEECGVDAIGPASEKFDSLVQAGTRIGGRSLLKLGKDTRQIIWGKFSGYDTAKSADPWIVLVFFDSTWLEVRSTDEAALARVAARFENVRPSVIGQ